MFKIEMEHVQLGMQRHAIFPLLKEESKHMLETMQTWFVFI
jgi:hypothetical protein